MEVKVPTETKQIPLGELFVDNTDWPIQFEYGTVYPKKDMRAILANGLHVTGTHENIKNFCKRRKTVIDRVVDNYEMPNSNIVIRV